jgi:hypothetical protein
MSTADAETREIGEAARAEAQSPSSPVARFGPDKPLRLDSGAVLSPFQIAYQTYGTLNAERSNANAMSERINMPMSLLGVVFMVILITPALLRVMGGL